MPSEAKGVRNVEEASPPPRWLRVLAPLALLLSSCNFAPKYDVPSIPIPAAYKEAAPGVAGAVVWRESQPQDAAIRADWWELYGDPVLDDLEREVVVSNQTIKADEAAYREAQAMVIQARAALFPTVSTTPSYTAYRSSSTVKGGGAAGGSSAGGSSAAEGGGGTGQTYSFPVDASWMPDLWGRIRNTVASDVYGAQASAGDLANARLSFQAEVAEDYFQMRALDREKKILGDTVAAYRRDLDLTRNLFQNGVDSEEDLAQAEAQLDGAIAEATDLGTSRAQYEHALAVLIGKTPAGFTLAPGTFDPKLPAIPVALPSQLLERRPDIAAAERRVAAANAQIGVARAAWFPDLTLAAEGGFESSSLSKWLTWPSRYWSLGPQVSETLLDFGARRGQNEQARAAYDQAVANYRQAVLSAFQTVEDNLANLRILDEESQQRLTAENAAHHYLNLSLERFKEGIDSYLNVATAQTTYLGDALTSVQTRLRQVNASVALVTALGGGWDTAKLPK